jgi:aspartyl-tRNA(Asn)/glutamyl-tRNA(Gln) amidotransferase subunit A
MAMISDPAALTITEARRQLAAGRLTAVELTEAVLDRVAGLNADLNAYLHVAAGPALAQARAADTGARRDHRPLLGIPLCVKDIVDVAGMPTTAGAAPAWMRTPVRDATVVARLRAAGAVLVGKGHTNEFAYGADGRNPHWNDCRNPYDPARVSGGSSSGPAVAAASGMALGGIGTDTSGSVRIPAALCGLVGVRPTLGRVSRAGVVPLSWSYDAVGPLARSVDDAALLLGVMMGFDPADPTSANRPVPRFEPRPDGIRGLRLGVIEELVAGAEQYVADGTTAAVEHLAALGAEIVPVRLDLLRQAAAMHLVVQQTEAAQVHAPWFDAHRDHYSEQVRRRLEAGQGMPAGAYLTAQQARRLLIDEVGQAMTRLDALLAPTVPVVAPPRTAAEVDVRGARVTLREAMLMCTLPLTQLGSPVATVPIGTHGGLPYGMQIAGRPFAEALVLRVAAACEQRWPWPDRRPATG